MLRSFSRRSDTPTHCMCRARMKPQASEVREHPGVLTDTYAPDPSSSAIPEFCRSSIDPFLSVQTMCTSNRHFGRLRRGDPKHQRRVVILAGIGWLPQRPCRLVFRHFRACRYGSLPTKGFALGDRIAPFQGFGPPHDRSGARRVDSVWKPDAIQDVT